MQPQFQSSFIPKGTGAPASAISTASPISSAAPIKHYSLLGIVGGWVFTIAVLLTAGLFGYKWYLNNQINQMASDLDTAGQSLESSAITDLTRLNVRLSSTKGLVTSHVVLSPVFDFLEQHTLQNVSFESFQFTTDSNTPKISLRGAARGYTAVASQAQEFNKATTGEKPTLSSIAFSNLALDTKGNVTFSVEAMVNPSLLSYASEFQPAVPASSTPAAPAFTATSTSPSVSQASTTAATTTVATMAGTACKANDYTCIINASKSCSTASMTATASTTSTRFDVVGKSGAQCHSKTTYVEAAASLKGKANDCTSAMTDLTGYLTAVQKGSSASSTAQFLANKCKLVSA